jgi:hypothetical protein
MLDDIPNDPSTSLENCTLDEVISILQNYACDPTVVTIQAGFSSFIANHVIKENLTGITRSPWSHLSLGMYGNQGFMSL